MGPRFQFGISLELFRWLALMRRRPSRAMGKGSFPDGLGQRRTVNRYRLKLGLCVGMALWTAAVSGYAQRIKTEQGRAPSTRRRRSGTGTRRAADRAGPSPVPPGPRGSPTWGPGCLWRGGAPSPLLRARPDPGVTRPRRAVAIESTANHTRPSWARVGSGRRFVLADSTVTAEV